MNDNYNTVQFNTEYNTTTRYRNQAKPCADERTWIETFDETFYDTLNHFKISSVFNGINEALKKELDEVA
jgi:hypothetical protein